MNLNNRQLNVLLYLVTLGTTAACLILLYRKQESLIWGGILLVFLLIILAARGFAASTSSVMPVFAAFWAILYATLPYVGALPDRLVGLDDTILRFFSSLRYAMPLLLAAAAALFLLGKFAKDSNHFLIILLRYLAYGTLMILLCIAMVQAVLPMKEEIIRAALLGPVFFGGICLCQELVPSNGEKHISYRSHFFWLTLCFSLPVMLFGPSAMWQIERILLGKDYRVLCAVAVAVLGVLLLTLKTDAEEWDAQLMGHRNQIFACFFFLWTAYSLLTLVWPQFFHQVVFLLGAPLSYLLYVFLRRFHSKALPLMQKTDNSFLLVYCAAALVLLLALGRTVSLRPSYLVLVALLLVVRYACTSLAKKKQIPLVMHCFRGVAALLLLIAAHLEPGKLFPARPSLPLFLGIALLWCFICFFLEKASADPSHIYTEEYAYLNKLRTWIPAALAVLTLLMLLR